MGNAISENVPPLKPHSDFFRTLHPPARILFKDPAKGYSEDPVFDVVMLT